MTTKVLELHAKFVQNEHDILSSALKSRGGYTQSLAALEEHEKKTNDAHQQLIASFKEDSNNASILIDHEMRSHHEHLNFLAEAIYEDISDEMLANQINDHDVLETKDHNAYLKKCTSVVSH